jgi:hypothetical protein
MTMSAEAKANIVLCAWVVVMLAMLGGMIAGLVLGYPQVLAMIFWMIIVTWVAGQILEGLERGKPR